MELSMQSFRDNGADLPPDKRARLEAIDRELTLASQRFNNLYMDARKSWTWTVRDAALLEGIDGSALQQARKEFLRRHPGQSDPGWTFTLDSAASARVMGKSPAGRVPEGFMETPPVSGHESMRHGTRHQGNPFPAP